MRKTVREVFIKWNPPTAGCFKLNTDGASKGNPGKASAGGLIWDHLGQWVVGFCRNIGTTSNVAAELWGLRDGLKLALERNILNLKIETDAILLKQLLSTNISASHQLHNLINDCRYLLSCLGTPTINHVYREANACADLLANLGASVENFQSFVNPPPLVCNQLLANALGISYPRLL
ncbi:hypothetical protein CsSME_00049425 [Camellia sinensis var. sinensis]